MTKLLIRLFIKNSDNVKDKNYKPVFHAAAYHLSESDKNCELLLFNLRNNCNKILGTKDKIVYCDIHSMNKILEEKKKLEDMVKGFKKGVNLNDGECKSAILEITGEFTANVTITEGRYHQIKRMFGCYGAKVVELNRICMGNLYLPKDLKLGEIKEASEDELKMIQEKEQ